MTWFIGVPVSLAPDEDAALPERPELVATRVADRHLTLVFLGQTREDVVRAVWRSVPRLDLPSQARAVRWERFGRSAIALVVADDDGRLGAAADACHDAAEPLIDVQRPSPFRPHVTIARVRRRARPPSAGVLRAWAVPEAGLQLGSLTLFRSRADRGDDRYEAVERRPGGR